MLFRQDKRYAFKPMQALDAMLKGMKNPDDTKQAARIVEAVQGKAPLRMVRRVKSTRKGRKLLKEKPDLLAALKDAKWLRSLPKGTLGRTYYEFCKKEHLTPGGLEEAVKDGYDQSRLELLSEDERFVQQWMRDSHDLTHVVTGYWTDLVGEVSVLAFTAAQTSNPGIWFLVLMGSAKLTMEGNAKPKVFLDAYLRGRKAGSFVTANWRELLEKPLDQVRKTLSVKPPPAYEQVYTPLDRATAGM